MSHHNPKPDLSSVATIQAIPDRKPCYWIILEYCRHLGVEKAPGRPVFWVAQIPRKDGGYKQSRIAIALDANGWVIDREAARTLAHAWFASTGVAQVASRPYPVGGTQTLEYEKTSEGFTIGGAMRDYVAWKSGRLRPEPLPTSASKSWKRRRSAAISRLEPELASTRSTQRRSASEGRR